MIKNIITSIVSKVVGTPMYPKIPSEEATDAITIIIPPILTTILLEP